MSTFQFSHKCIQNSSWEGEQNKRLLIAPIFNFPQAQTEIAHGKLNRTRDYFCPNFQLPTSANRNSSWETE